jgi:DnaJ-domain-containing protein 1
VSDYSSAEFGAMPKQEVIRSLLAHQMVVEHVMREHTVLPVKFATVLASSEEVRQLLAQGHRQFVEALTWIQDKVEVEVAATWDMAQVLQEISNEEDIVRAREAVANKTGQQILEKCIYLGQMVKASMDRRRDGYRERMISFLKPAAFDVQANALVSDEMVMNVAFLIERARQEEFDGRVKQLNDLFHDQIGLRIIGPLPPYSFATVEIARPNPEKIEEARQLLNLNGVVAESEVRKAYRRLAAETHPDRKPGDELAKLRFAKLRQASDLLIAYCRSQAKSDGSLLIRIRRSKDEEVQHLRFAETEGVAGAVNG